MEIRSYNSELTMANLLFSRLFRNIVIERTINNKITEIPVYCVIGNRSRIFKNLENAEKTGTYKFPLIVITRTGISVNSERLANLHNEIKYQVDSKHHNYDIMTPVPVDLQYTVSVISKNPLDQDLIMSNFFPFFNSDLYVSSVHPKFTNVKYNSQVIMDSSVNEEHPEELDGTTDDFIVNSFQFTFKTYIFGGCERAAAGIHKISTDVSGGTDVIYDGFVPTIQTVNLDMHAVPYLDRSNQKYVTSVFTKVSTWTEYEGIPELSHECSANLTLSVDVLSGVYDPYKEYSIDKYFQDIGSQYIDWEGESGVSGNVLYPDTKVPNMAYDVLRWRIDDNGVFRLDNNYFNKHGDM